MEVQRRNFEARAAQMRLDGIRKQVALLQAAELKAVQEREAAEETAREVRESLRKRQRTEGEAKQETETEAATDDKPTWKEWVVSRWRKHETETQKRRAVEVDPSNVDESLPHRGGEDQGWRKHWRRGLYGAVQHWAQRDRGSVSLSC